MKSLAKRWWLWMLLFVLRPIEDPLLAVSNATPSSPLSGTRTLAIWNALDQAAIGVTGVIFVATVVFFVLAANVRHAIQRRSSATEVFDFDSDAREALIAFYHAKSEPAFEAAYHLLGRVTFRLMDRPGADRYVGQLIDDFLRDEARQISVTLDKACAGERDLAPDNSALQALFGSHYEKYQLMVMWIDHGCKILNFALKDDREYKLWQTLDGEFLRSLKELIARSRFERLRGRVTDIGWGEAFRPAVPLSADQAQRQFRVVT
ncbi:MAG: hypothetical protein ACREEE_10725 [Dongiaceae bacterium]